MTIGGHSLLPCDSRSPKEIHITIKRISGQLVVINRIIVNATSTGFGGGVFFGGEEVAWQGI